MIARVKLEKFMKFRIDFKNNKIKYKFKLYATNIV